MNKIDRYLKTLPSVYATQPGTVLRALLEAWAVSDEDIEVQISESKKQLFISLASSGNLDSLAANLGVSRPIEINIDDERFRNFIPVMSFYPKQVRNTMYDLLDVFWGPLYSRANITSPTSDPYNFGATTGLTGVLSFTNGSIEVSGSGTLFLGELAVGDFIRLSSDPNANFRKIAQVISNTRIVLSTPYSRSSSGPAVSYQAKTLTLKVDNSAESIVFFSPIYFMNLSAVTANEVAVALNSLKGQSITASIVAKPLLGLTYLNIRTNAAGPTGSIQITGGTSNTLLNFQTTEIIITDMNRNTVIYEINPRELIIRLPDVLPSVRRTLRGSHHFHSNYSGNVIAVDNFAKTVTVDFNDYVIANLHALNTFTQENIQSVISSHVAGQSGIVLHLDPLIDLSIVTLNGFCILDQTDNGFIGSFLFDTVSATYTASKDKARLNQTITAGSVYPTITVSDASSIPNSIGYLIFGMGTGHEQQPVKYRGRPNNSTILLDPSYAFTISQPIGTSINVLSSLRGTIPQTNGSDNAIYLVGTQEARLKVQAMLQDIKAAGVVIRFIIDLPQYLFTQCINNN